MTEQVAEPQTSTPALPILRRIIRPFAAYFAVGDSMSMDIYPKYDAEDKGGRMGYADGASNLLHEALSLHPDVRGKYRVFQNLIEDGATCKDLLAQIARINPRKFALKPGEPVLVTITAGGNDLLRTMPVSSFAAVIEELDQAMEQLGLAIERIKRQLPENPVTILLGNVYDPTDGTGELRLHNTMLDLRLQLRNLEYWNSRVFGLANRTDIEIVPINVWSQFFGHGANGRLGIGAMLNDLSRCHTERFWYWGRSWIEPGVEGAIQLAALWYKAVTKVVDLGDVVREVQAAEREREGKR
jgi:lysophospholipase L1-like esterase